MKYIISYYHVYNSESETMNIWALWTHFHFRYKDVFFSVKNLPIWKNRNTPAFETWIQSVLRDITHLLTKVKKITFKLVPPINPKNWLVTETKNMFVDSSASGPPSVYSSLTLALVTSTWWHSLQISVRIVIIAVMLCSILNPEEIFEHVYLVEELLSPRLF